MGLIYGLYSTRDGRVRYVGQSEYTARKRLDRWITDALDRKAGAVSEWIQRLSRLNGFFWYTYELHLTQRGC